MTLNDATCGDREVSVLKIQTRVFVDPEQLDDAMRSTN
jgi:hypothetical protein